MTMFQPESPSATVFTGVSIIIPCHNYSQSFTRCLDAIVLSADRLSDYDRSRMEVIVVDDASKPPLVLRNIQLSIRIIRLEAGRGAGYARNAGLCSAKWSHLLFVDSDVYLAPDHLPCLFARLTSSPTRAVLQGLHYPYSAGVEPDLFMHYLAASWYVYMSTELLDSNRNPAVVFTACFAIGKKFLQDLGGFSERFSGSGGEEFELSARISNLPENPIRLDPQLLSAHVYDTAYWRLKKLWRRSRHYELTIGKILNIPSSFRRRTLARLSIACAQTFALMLTIIAIANPFWNPAIPGMVYGILLIFSSIYDRRQTCLIARQHGWKLVALSPFFRQLEFITVSLGMVVQFIRGRIK